MGRWKGGTSETAELAATEVERESDFSWKAQLRYYWEPEALPEGSRKKAE